MERSVSEFRCYLRIELRGYDVAVSEYTAHALDGHALAEYQCRKPCLCAVKEMSFVIPHSQMTS